ncbi:MAG TPA: hypothetical protein ENK18_17860 [Deltaproteobacteria bacterium]|nr:hypothetical protein [Deltaproteobacteria bacterium]
MIAWILSSLASAACTVIAGATVHAPEGPQKGLTVVVQDAEIVATGRGIEGLSLELDAQQQVSGATWQGRRCAFVQAGGKQLTAGLVAVPTQIGLVEIGLEPSTRSSDPGTDDPIRASLDIVDAYDPRSTLIPVSRIEGITTSVIVPGGGFVSGAAGLVVLRGSTQADTILSRRVAMAVSLPSGSSAEGLRQLSELIREARDWARNPAAFERSRPLPEGASRLDLEAMGPVSRGALPILIGADRASELEALIRVASELKIRVILVGAAEGWMLADQLAEAGIPVILDPLVYGPGGFDQRGARADNARLLAEAGVEIILTAGFGVSHNARTLRQAAGNAVRGGLPHGEALRAITATPAAVFGAESRGRIEPGAVADLALWSGDPLELSTSLVGLWIEGAPVPLRSRQTELAERYLTLPVQPRQPLPLPDAGG